MRRLILILLLSLLPLQASWAAVCAYCPGQCIVETSDAQASAASLAAEQADALDADVDCSCCQLGGVGIASMAAISDFTPPQHGLAPRLSAVQFASIRPDRPERPKWQRAA
jgi:hypothetical protein